MGELFRPTHLLLVIIIALLVFGPNKFKDIGKSLGEGFRNFKSAMKEGEEGKQEKNDEKKS